ncbi:MAG: DNA alkylation repair protein [Acidobacteriaceae bacterium]
MKSSTRRSQSLAAGTRAALVRELAALGSPARAAGAARFFKSGVGEYGEGDKFIGIPVLALRSAALRYRTLPLSDLALLLASDIHEHRLAALEILVAQYEIAAEKERKNIVEFYLAHTEGINNWDLVDASAPYILGEHLKNRSRRVLLRLAKSKSVWERRIAIVATLMLIRYGETADTFLIAEKLLRDPHDLIHKAVGWALREAGKVSQPDLLAFLELHYASIPRTTLRYAIERFPQQQRKRMLAGKF